MSVAIVSDGRQLLGRWGEKVAAHFLEAKGYVIVERNWRTGRGELDLVAQDGPLLVFVEVKTRRGQQYGTPEESITPRKQEKLLELVQLYLTDHALTDVEWRVDVVAIELDKQGKLIRCEHIPEALLGW